MSPSFLTRQMNWGPDVLGGAVDETAPPLPEEKNKQLVKSSKKGSKKKKKNRKLIEDFVTLKML